jgi:hypothetical protein
VDRPCLSRWSGSRDRRNAACGHSGLTEHLLSAVSGRPRSAASCQ